jgi:hypothetical protein
MREGPVRCSVALGSGHTAMLFDESAIAWVGRNGMGHVDFLADVEQRVIEKLLLGIVSHASPCITETARERCQALVESAVLMIQRVSQAEAMPPVEEITRDPLAGLPRFGLMLQHSTLRGITSLVPFLARAVRRFRRRWPNPGIQSRDAAEHAIGRVLERAAVLLEPLPDFVVDADSRQGGILLHCNRIM